MGLGQPASLGNWKSKTSRLSIRWMNHGNENSLNSKLKKALIGRKLGGIRGTCSGICETTTFGTGVIVRVLIGAGIALVLGEEIVAAATPGIEGGGQDLVDGDFLAMNFGESTIHTQH